MQDGVVDRDATGNRLVKNAGNAPAIAVEKVERQRPVAGIDEGQRLIEMPVGDDGQQRAKNFFLHQPPVGIGIDNQRRRQAPGVGVLAVAERNDLSAIRPCFIEQTLQTPPVTAIDDGGVVAVGRKIGIAGGDHLPCRLDEDREFSRRQQDVIRGNTGLAGVQAFAGENPGCGRFDRIVRCNQRRRFAAQFERHRCQVGCRRLHDVPPDSGRAGEEQMVEGKGGEGCRQRLIATDDRQLVAAEIARRQFGEDGCGRRRKLRHLEQCPITGGEGCGQRAEGEVDWIVPGADDADTAQRLRAKLGTPGLEP